jgi:Dyp-type peroxidase family
MDKPNDRSLEPLLPMSDIQGIVVPGFLKPHQTLIGVKFPRGGRPVLKLKKFLRDIGGEISTADYTLRDRREHRTRARAAKSETESTSTVLLALAVSFPGLLKLTADARAMTSQAFKIGLAGRSRLLGDPSHGPGSVAAWEIGQPGKGIDGLFVVAGDRRLEVSKKVEELVRAARSAGLGILYREDGDIRPDHPGREHFGFDDGVSQPGIRGRASERDDDFVTDGYIAPDQIPETHLSGYPGQDLVWPGVFVLGQPGASPDPLLPGVATPAVPKWTANGSFLVFRRLVQDVGLFWRTMHELAEDLSDRPGFKDIDEDWLAARLVGRWPSGAPVNRVPNRDNSNLGHCKYANNHFRFDSNSARMRLVSGYSDEFTMAPADPAGLISPWSSHIRKVNTRDSGSDTGGRDSTYTRRLLRVGIPFGPPLKNRFALRNRDKHFGKRGLLFLSIQASIEDQFEFLMARWMGDASRPKMPGGHDMVVGQNDSHGENRQRRCVIFGTDAQEAELRTRAQWIIPTGGGYFFVPSITALRHVLGR